MLSLATRRRAPAAAPRPPPTGNRLLPNTTSPLPPPPMPLPTPPTALRSPRHRRAPLPPTHPRLVRGRARALPQSRCACGPLSPHAAPRHGELDTRRAGERPNLPSPHPVAHEAANPRTPCGSRRPRTWRSRRAATGSRPPLSVGLGGAPGCFAHARGAGCAPTNAALVGREGTAEEVGRPLLGAMRGQRALPGHNATCTVGRACVLPAGARFKDVSELFRRTLETGTPPNMVT
ncbi:hypothetical protein BS78_05G204900 [Paspalum vaginatum]|nr:hypothetical protein BS78_05G204900 [Paspalum vaginatum]